MMLARLHHISATRTGETVVTQYHKDDMSITHLLAFQAFSPREGSSLGLGALNKDTKHTITCIKAIGQSYC